MTDGGVEESSTDVFFAHATGRNGRRRQDFGLRAGAANILGNSRDVCCDAPGRADRCGGRGIGDGGSRTVTVGTNGGPTVQPIDDVDRVTGLTQQSGSDRHP